MVSVAKGFILASVSPILSSSAALRGTIAWWMS